MKCAEWFADLENKIRHKWDETNKRELTAEFEEGGHCQGIPWQSSPYVQLWLAKVLCSIWILLCPRTAWWSSTCSGTLGRSKCAHSLQWTPGVVTVDLQNLAVWNGATNSSNQCNLGDNGSQCTGQPGCPVLVIAPFTNNDFHALEPAGHGWVIISKVKQLCTTGGKLAIVHVVATCMVYPAQLWGWKGWEISTREDVKYAPSLPSLSQIWKCLLYCWNWSTNPRQYSCLHVHACQYTYHSVSSHIAIQVQPANSVLCTLRWMVCQYPSPRIRPASLGLKWYWSRLSHQGDPFSPSPPVQIGSLVIFPHLPRQLHISSSTCEVASLKCGQILWPTLGSFAHALDHAPGSSPQQLMPSFN